MSHISFNLASRCEKAGRKANQDSVMVSPDVSNIADNAFKTSIDLGTLYNLPMAGTLLVVADGMGGMNAGEKASELVITGLVNAFSRVSEKDIIDTTTATRFMAEAVVHADSKIKEYARQHPETHGMGSTVAMVWLLGGKALCLWCGDSRIYRFNPANGIVRLSHDHSYVQALVDNGKIDPEDAFDHPDSNIITRSLGDSGETARPQTAIYDIYENDIFLLCSDGLSGLLPDPKIGEILRANSTSVSNALEALWKTGEQEGFSDNCTIVLCRIAEGGLPATKEVIGYPEPTPPRRRPVEAPKKETPAATVTAAATRDTEAKAAREKLALEQKAKAVNKRNWAILAVACVIVVTAAWMFLPYLYPDKDPAPETRGRTVASGTIDPNEHNDKGMAQPTVTREPRPDKTPAETKTTPEPNQATQTESPSQTAAAVPESFYNRLNSLYSQIGNINKIMRDAQLTEESKAKIESFVKNSIALSEEYNNKHYALDSQHSGMLSKLVATATGADAYIKKVKVKPKEPKAGTTAI